MGRQSHFYPNLPLLLGLQAYFWTAPACPVSIDTRSISKDNIADRGLVEIEPIIQKVVDSKLNLI